MDKTNGGINPLEKIPPYNIITILNLVPYSPT